MSTLPNGSEDFSEWLESWENSKVCSEVKSKLTSGSLAGVNKVLGFAVGPFENHRYQVPALLTLRDLAVGAGCVQFFAQGTDSHASEEALLAEKVVYSFVDPDGFERIGQDSAVVSICSDIPYDRILRARPKAIIWPKVLEASDTGRSVLGGATFQHLALRRS